MLFSYRPLESTSETVSSLAKSSLGWRFGERFVIKFASSFSLFWSRFYSSSPQGVNPELSGYLQAVPYHATPGDATNSPGFFFRFPAVINRPRGGKLQKHCNQHCCCSTAKLYLTLCNPMDCLIPGSSVLHYLPEFAQIHVFLTVSSFAASFSFAFYLSQHPGFFQWLGSSHQVIKVLELQLQHQSFQWTFRVDFLWDWLVWSSCSPSDSQESSPAPQFKSTSFPGKNTGVGFHFLLQGNFLVQGSNPHLLHWQADSSPLHHLGSPYNWHNQQKQPLSLLSPQLLQFMENKKTGNNQADTFTLFKFITLIHLSYLHNNPMKYA